MPFGLCNAPSTFQAIMNVIFQPYLHKFVLVFFDDILVYSLDWQSHLVHVRQVFELLRQNRFFMKLKKCVWPAKIRIFGPHHYTEWGTS